MTDYRKQLARHWAIRSLGILLPALLMSGCAIDDQTNVEPLAQSWPQISVTGSGGATMGPLRIERVELNFFNDRGQATVARGSVLHAYAVIRFDGNGLFRARWEVDKRILEEVVTNVTHGDTLTVRMQRGISLPTFEPGPHRVRLNIEEPTPDFELPVIQYFVTADSALKKGKKN